MAAAKSVMLTVVLAAQGLASGSFSNHKGNIQLGVPVAANVLPRLAPAIQARQTSSPGAWQTSSLTAVQVPIATVCPLDGSPISSSAFKPVSLLTVTLSDVTDLIISASAIMADGSTTTFASRARRQDVATRAQLVSALTLPGGIIAIPLLADQSEAGQLVVGLDGCQTLFSPTLTAVCSTVVSPAGLPAVTITDCDQYVTFSSETLFTCSPSPTYFPRPYSTTSASNRTITLGDDMFTTRAFPTRSTGTMGEDSNDGVRPTAISGESTQPRSATLEEEESEDLDDEDNGIGRRNFLKRPLAFARSKNAPVQTDLDTIAPTSSVSLEKRQVMFNRSGNKPAIIDLETIAPTFSSQPKKRQMMFDHNVNKPIKTDLETIAPAPTPRYVRAPLMVSSYTTGIPANTTNATDRIFEAVGVATRILSVPPVLRTKYNREHAVLRHHPRQLEQDKVELHSEFESELPATPRPLPPQLNSTTNTTRLLDSTSSSITLPLADRLALLSPPQPTKYYAAPWASIAAGGVPRHVKGITCYGGLPPSGACTTPDTDGDTEGCECETDDEVWTVTTLSETHVGTTVASFSGPAVLTYGSITTTTNINFTSTLTTTRVVPSESVVRRTLKPSEVDEEELTITIQQTSIPYATISLLPGDAMKMDKVGDMDVAIKAGMPQDAPAVLTSMLTSDTPTDETATPVPDPEVSILPYYDTTSTYDGYYGATTTIPFESMGMASGVVDANLNSGADRTIDGADVSTSAPTGMDDLPTTVFETRVVATETVTVGEGSMTMQTGAEAEMVAQATPTLASAVKRRDDGWPDDVWLAHIEDVKGSQEPVQEGGA